MKHTQSGVKVTDEQLQRVAELYNEAREGNWKFGGIGKIAPVIHIANRLNISRNNARLWVSKARQRGFLPEVQKGAIGPTHIDRLAERLSIDGDDIRKALKELNLKLSFRGRIKNDDKS